MEPDGSSPHSQEPATCPYFEPDRFNLCPPNPTSSRCILILSSHLRLGLPKGLISSRFPTEALYAPVHSPIRATCPAHLSLLDFITQMIFGEEYRAQSFSLCSLLHSPVALSLLGPNILLNRLFNDYSVNLDILAWSSSLSCWSVTCKVHPRLLFRTAPQ